MHRSHLNCFLSEADGRNGISTIRETDNEQNKRSEEKQKTQLLPCVGEGFAPVLLSCEKNGGRIFPRSPPRRVAPLLPRDCARAASFFLTRVPERAGKADEGW